MREKMNQMSHYLYPFLEQLSLFVKEAANPNQNAQSFINAAQPYLAVLERALDQFTSSEKTIEYSEHFPSNKSLHPLAFLIQILNEVNPNCEVSINKDISEGKLRYKYIYACDYFLRLENKTSLDIQHSPEELVARYLRVQLRYNFLQINELLQQLHIRSMLNLRERPVDLLTELEILKSNIDKIYQIGVNRGLAETSVFIDTPSECKRLKKAIESSLPNALTTAAENFKNGFSFNNQYSFFPQAKNSSRSTPSTSINPVNSNLSMVH